LIYIFNKHIKFKIKYITNIILNMNPNSFAMQNRVNSILHQRAMLGAGEGGVLIGGARRRKRRAAPRRRRAVGYGYPDIGLSNFGHGDYGMGCLDTEMRALPYYGEGVLIGGARRKRRPSAWNMKVKKWIHQHGGTVADAAHALRGSGAGYGSPTGGYRRRRAAPVRRRRAYGGARSVPSDLYLTKADLNALKREEKKAVNRRFCSPDALNRRLDRATSKAEVERIRNDCGLNPLTQRKKNLLANLRDLSMYPLQQRPRTRQQAIANQMGLPVGGPGPIRQVAVAGPEPDIDYEEFFYN
jgi:hypothetical protein